jgi:hypothetical protein
VVCRLGVRSHGLVGVGILFLPGEALSHGLVGVGIPFLPGEALSHGPVWAGVHGLPGAQGAHRLQSSREGRTLLRDGRHSSVYLEFIGVQDDLLPT